MPQRMIGRHALGALTKLGQGGQGVVYSAPNATTKFAESMVYKEYKPDTRAVVRFETLTAMPTLVDNILSEHDRMELVTIAAWPCALVEDSNVPVGFVMPAIPKAFYIDLTTVKGVSRTAAEFQHLLNPPSVLAARNIVITDRQRYQLLRAVAKGLSFLHRIGVCVGDISPKNLLFSLKPLPAVYFIDCDAMRINGASALPQVETPEWEVPAGEELATVQSDTYKLGLLALRLLTGDQHTKDTQQLPPTTPKLVRQLINDTLVTDPSRRPLPETWVYLLRDAIGDTKDGAGTRPTPPTPKAKQQKHAPEPPPVVRSRPTAAPPARKPVATQRPSQPTSSNPPSTASSIPAAVWVVGAIGSVVVLLTALIVFAISSSNGSSPSTREVRSSPSTSRSMTTSPQPNWGNRIQPTTQTTSQLTPTAAATALTPNQYGIVYIRTASGRTICMLETDQVICKAHPSIWPKDGVIIGVDGSTRFQSGDFGDIRPQTIGYEVYNALGWTIAASSSGTQFTNSRTGHGAFVSAEQVQGF